MKFLAKFSSQTKGRSDPDLPLVDLAESLGAAMRRLIRLSRQLRHDEFRKQLLVRLEGHHDELARLAQGNLTFDSTETWRAVYEDVLSQCQLKRYLSVALVRTEDYWSGMPGDRSFSFNGTLVQAGFYVHRMFIVDDFLWPVGATLPSKRLYSAIIQQYSQGIQVGLLRISELDQEPDLIRDFGIYGDAAVGTQVTDNDGQTIRYEMQFGRQHVRVAEDRWKRLSLYARPFESI